MVSYRFGEEEVTIHTTASISEGALAGMFTRAGHSIPVGTPKRTTDRIWIGRANGDLPLWVTSSVKTNGGIWIGPKDGAAPFRSVTNQSYATNAMSELPLTIPQVRTSKGEHSCTIGMTRKEVRAALADSWLYVSASRPPAGWSRGDSPPAGGRAARFESSPSGAVESCDVYWIGHAYPPKTHFGKRLDCFYFDRDEKLIGFDWCILD